MQLDGQTKDWSNKILTCILSGRCNCHVAGKNPYHCCFNQNCFNEGLSTKAYISCFLSECLVSDTSTKDLGKRQQFYLSPANNEDTVNEMTSDTNKGIRHFTSAGVQKRTVPEHCIQLRCAGKIGICFECQTSQNVG